MNTKIRILLIEALDNLQIAYPAFMPKDAGTKALDILRERHREHMEAALSEFDSFPEAVYEDIHDDINNCGRNPLSKFMEQAEYLMIIKEDDLETFNEIMDYLAHAINSNL